MNDTIDAPADEQPLTDTLSDAPATEAPETTPDDGDGLAPGQTTADNHGDILGV
jgi:hypothetical protein